MATIKPSPVETPTSVKPVVDPTTGQTTGSVTDSEGALTGDQRNAYEYLQQLFAQYDLGDLAPNILSYVQQGYGADTITLLLQDTAAYKSRFSANEARKKAGLPVLSPAEYVSTERSYRQIMQAAGLPLGFYDTTTDFQSFLEKDISPTELQSRVQDATDFVYKNFDQSTQDYLKQWYGVGDLVAYALDSKVAEPLINQRIRTAALGSTGLDERTAADLVNGSDMSQKQLQQAAGFVSSQAPTLHKLNSLYGGDDVTTEDMARAVVDNDQTAADKVSKLASQERGAFAATSSQAKGSLSRRDGGSF